jgi:hypothetical protein
MAKLRATFFFAQVLLTYNKGIQFPGVTILAGMYGTSTLKHGGFLLLSMVTKGCMEILRQPEAEAEAANQLIQPLITRLFGADAAAVPQDVQERFINLIISDPGLFATIQPLQSILLSTLAVSAMLMSRLAAEFG